jgi:hypothetical protein
MLRYGPGTGDSVWTLTGLMMLVSAERGRLGAARSLTCRLFDEWCNDSLAYVNKRENMWGNGIRVDLPLEVIWMSRRR